VAAAAVVEEDLAVVEEVAVEEAVVATVVEEAEGDEVDSQLPETTPSMPRKAEGLLGSLEPKLRLIKNYTLTFAHTHNVTRVFMYKANQRIVSRVVITLLNGTYSNSIEPVGFLRSLGCNIAAPRRIKLPALCLCQVLCLRQAQSFCDT
jgi:hypothetical protein